MSDTYTLEKQLWTDADFDVMGWHDSLVHAISFGRNDQLVLDIDYIFEWVHPKEGETNFKFWIAPCTLIFEDVYNIAFDLEVSVPQDLAIDDIVKSESKVVLGDQLTEHSSWTIETLNGDISFNATGYKQYVRRQPQLVDAQELDMSSRGGISFSTSFTD
jgi:hypothetical protein